jgi:hypothetical protein
MNKPGKFVLPGLLLLMATALAAVALSAHSTEAAPSHSAQAAQAAQAAQTVSGQPLQFYTRTLATVDLGSGVETTFEWLEVSHDWVAYALGQLGCGHCGIQRTSISLLNVLANQKVSIRGSYWSTDSTSDAPVGIGNIKFDAPYLVWTQPGKVVPGSQYHYAAGDYDCILCYYNVDTGKGGAVTSLQNVVVDDPKSPITLFDANYLGQVLVMPAKGSDFWVGNITSSDKLQIPAGINPQNVKEGLIGLNNAAVNGIVWIEGDRVLYWTSDSKAVHQVGTKGERLRGHGYDVFWYAPGGVYVPDGSPINNSKTTTGTLVVPGATSQYDARTTTPLGDIASWVENDQNGHALLSVVSFSATGGTSTLMKQTVPGPLDKLSMWDDKLVYEQIQNTSQLPILSIQLVWLLKPDEAFNKVWAKADQPVAAGTAQRSWLWGPQPNYLGLETYKNASQGTRMVQYYDKSRMEVNNSQGNKDDPYYVTNGLLTTEMIAGEIQLGDAETVKASVACTIPVAGDPRKDNPLTPGYSTLAAVSSLHGENQSPNRVGQPVNQSIDVHGIVAVDSAHGNLSKYAAFASQTGHNIPDLFWKYLQGMQPVYGFDWTFVLGYPISEAYWTQMRVSGKGMPVMIQAYQRRVLTYVPDFPPEWRIQMGNVGQHYFEWRYVMNANPAP